MLVFNHSLQVFQTTLLPLAITHGFGTRMTGDGRDLGQITQYFDRNNISTKRIVDPDQHHSDTIVVVNEQTNTTDIRVCDGLITGCSGTALSVVTADCMPILYADVRANKIGISHNGRVGTNLQLAKKMIKQFVDSGSDLSDLRVALGPAIGACCYPMNLIRENISQLISEGLVQPQIDWFPFCTQCDSHRFFSYRGSGKAPNFPEQFSYISHSAT